ncbi:MAG: hypothetical protein AAFV53_03065 [Myxococcota bacterium]
MGMTKGIVHLHGRQYKTVALRVQEFRLQHPISDGWAITTELVHCNDATVLMKAVIADPQGRTIASGYAEEKRAARGINATSALENCETSAIGRALAAAGFAGTEYASADELVNALNQQRGMRSPSATPASSNAEAAERGHHPSWTRDHKRFYAELKERGLEYRDIAEFCEKKRWGKPASWPTADRNTFLRDLDEGKFKDIYDPAIAGEEPVFVPDAGVDTDIDHVA